MSFFFFFFGKESISVQKRIGVAKIYINTVLNLSYAHTKHICRNTESKNQTMEAVLSSSSSSTLEWPGGFVFDPLDEVLVLHYLHPRPRKFPTVNALK